MANPGRVANRASTIVEYFARVDSDGSGDLDHQELVRLIKFYDENNKDPRKDAPRLPDTWA